jgi:hypothetical protein
MAAANGSKGWPTTCCRQRAETWKCRLVKAPVFVTMPNRNDSGDPRIPGEPAKPCLTATLCLFNNSRAIASHSVNGRPIMCTENSIHPTHYHDSPTTTTSTTPPRPRPHKHPANMDSHPHRPLLQQTLLLPSSAGADVSAPGTQHLVDPPLRHPLRHP